MKSRSESWSGDAVTPVRQRRASLAEEAAAAAGIHVLELDRETSGSVRYSSGVPPSAPPRLGIRSEM